MYSGNEVGDNSTISDIYLSYNDYYFSIWYPDTILEMHFWWSTSTNGVYSAYERIDDSTGLASRIH